MLEDEIKKELTDILIKHNVKKAAVFGSYAKGNSITGDSDLDIIVELSKNDLIELAALKSDLEEKLNIPVDIVTYSGLDKFSTKEDFKKEVLEQQEVLI